MIYPTHQAGYVQCINYVLPFGFCTLIPLEKPLPIFKNRKKLEFHDLLFASSIECLVNLQRFLGGNGGFIHALNKKFAMYLRDAGHINFIGYKRNSDGGKLIYLDKIFRFDIEK